MRAVKCGFSYGVENSVLGILSSNIREEGHAAYLAQSRVNVKSGVKTRETNGKMNSTRRIDDRFLRGNTEREGYLVNVFFFL